MSRPRGSSAVASPTSDVASRDVREKRCGYTGVSKLCNRRIMCKRFCEIWPPCDSGNPSKDSASRDRNVSRITKATVFERRFVAKSSHIRSFWPPSDASMQPWTSPTPLPATQTESTTCCGDLRRARPSEHDHRHPAWCARTSQRLRGKVRRRRRCPARRSSERRGDAR